MVVLESFKIHCQYGSKVHWKVILIWMLFSITLGNYFFHISQATKYLYRIASSCINFDLISFVLSKIFKIFFLHVLD